MGLREDLDRVATASARRAKPGEELTGVVPTEAVPGERTYLCAFAAGEERTWLVVDDRGEPVIDREVIRRTASIAALCELAEESAGGGELDELRERLVAIRLTESPDGIEEAEEAALALQHTIGAPPRLAEPRRLEGALGSTGVSPFAEAMKAGSATIEELARDVLANYRARLD